MNLLNGYKMVIARKKVAGAVYGNLFIDGEGTIEDESGTNTLSANGGAAVSAAQYCAYGSSASSVELALSKSVTAPYNSSFAFGSNWTIDGFFRVTSQKDNQGFFGINRASQNDYLNGGGVVAGWVSNTTLNFRCYAAPYNTHFAALEMEPSNNTWIHFAYVRSGSNFYLFKDGALADSTTDSTVIADDASNRNFLLGGFRASYITSYGFPGFIDNFRFKNDESLWTSAFTLSNANLFYAA